MHPWIETVLGLKDFTIFISHSFKDNDWLDDYLAGVVSNLGAKYIMAEHTFSQSNKENITQKIKRQIDCSHALLAVLSKDGNASKFVHHEIAYADAKGKPIIALIEADEKGEIKKEGFLYDKEVLTFKDRIELHDLRAKLKKIILDFWDKKNVQTISNAITGSLIVVGVLIVSSLDSKK